MYNRLCLFKLPIQTQIGTPQRSLTMLDFLFLYDYIFLILVVHFQNKYDKIPTRFQY